MRFGPSHELRQREMREGHSQGAPPAMDVPAGGPDFQKRHYTPLELAGAWRLSVEVVRRLFENEPGVLIFGDARGTRSKRRYRTLRIPQDVAQRVYHRLQHVYNQKPC